jgi:hypothetical protein
MTTYTGTVTVTDSKGKTATSAVTITELNPPLSVTNTVEPPEGDPGTEYTITAKAAGGKPPYQYAISPIDGVTPTEVSPGVWTVAPSTSPPVPVPAAGWTVVQPTDPSGAGSAFNGAGSRMIYVSSSTGNDANPGTQESPVATIAHGVTLLRTGFPDQMLMKCGDVWTDDIIDAPHLNGVTQSGPWGTTITGPILFGQYGSGARPKIQLNKNFFSAFGGGGGSGFYKNLAFVGLEFYGYSRDPEHNSGEYSTADAAAHITGFNLQNDLAANGPNNILFEDLKISYLTEAIVIDGAGTLQTGHAIRRCVIANNWFTQQAGPGNVSGGIYVGSADNILIEENFFDQNGYLEGYSDTAWSGSDGPHLTHNMYIQSDNGPDDGAPWSPVGSTVDGIQVNGPRIFVKGNVCSRGLSEQARCGGLVYDNSFVQLSSGWNLGYKGGLVQHNICTENHPTWFTAVPEVADGCGFTFGHNNDVGGFPGGPVYLDHNLFVNQGAGSPGSNIQYESNKTFLPDSLFLTGNIIFNGNGQETPPTGVVAANDTYIDVSGSNTGGPPEPFPVPSSCATSYAATLGYASWDAFCQAARGQSRQNWNPALMAASINNYIRAGFNMPLKNRAARPGKSA